MSAPPAAPPIELGPFALLAPIALGGMGAIWRGLHRPSETPVAVKVMLADGLQSPTFREAFRNEVWAMASLDHRGVVMVFDQGLISDEVAAQSGGQLPAGAPYIVMDLVDGGILEPRAIRSWWDLKGTLLLLLDALAHAHARGVIHRDLKPANILRDADPSRSGGLQLTDFGIAHAAERTLGSGEASALPVMGTLHYMAPEQLDGRWRDYGPWTDLYSLGCIAWELATGSLPFLADDPLDLMDMHLEEEPDLFEARVPVPEGFEGWVRGLLVKEPFARPQRAADAGRALKDLGEPEDPARVRALGLTMMEGIPVVTGAQIEARLSLPPEERARDAGAVQPRRSLGLETLSRLAPVGLDPSPGGTWDDDDPDPHDDESSAGPGSRLQLSWRRQRRPRPWRSLVGAGLGLWGIRTIPLVGRDEELDVLWDALRATHMLGRARVVSLEGALGTGTSRIARWMCERAHELGVADVYWATHSPVSRPSDGLGRMVGREFRCVGMSVPMRVARIEEVVLRRALCAESGALELAEGLARWMDAARPRYGTHPPAADPVGSPGAEPGPERPRFRWLYKLLRRSARRRPVLLWLDDAQWAGEALAFADYVMRAQERRPAEILVVVTIQKDALEPDGRSARLLGALRGAPDTAQVSVLKLEAEAQEMLVRDLLGLDGDLARRVAAASDGNPLFATQLVGAWVRSGVLQPGPRGFELKPGANALIPADLPALWLQRVETALADLGPGARRALELAAALGGRVDAREYLTIAAAVGLTVPERFVERLFEERLAVPSKDGWSFVHDALRVSLRRESRQSGRWVDLRLAVQHAQGRRRPQAIVTAVSR